VLGPDARYVVDITGITESFPEPFTFPNILANGRRQLAFGEGIATFEAGWVLPIQIEAVPTEVQTFTPTGTSQDPVTNLVSVTLAGAGWTVNEHKGRIVDLGVLGGAVIASNTSDTLEVTSQFLPPGDVVIYDRSATLVMNDSGNTLPGFRMCSAVPTAFVGIDFQHANQTDDFAVAVDLQESPSSHVFHLCRTEGAQMTSAMGAIFDQHYFVPAGGNRKDLTPFLGSYDFRNCFLEQVHYRDSLAQTDQFHSDNICDSCTALGHGNDQSAQGPYAFLRCAIRNGPGDGVRFTGGRCHLNSCDIHDNGGDGIFADGVGTLRLTNVQGTGNTSLGVEARNGVHVRALNGTGVTGGGGDIQVGGAGVQVWGAAPINDLAAATPEGVYLFT